MSKKEEQTKPKFPAFRGIDEDGEERDGATAKEVLQIHIEELNDSGPDVKGLVFKDYRIALSCTVRNAGRNLLWSPLSEPSTSC